MPNVQEAKIIGEAIRAMMAELGEMWPRLSDAEKQRVLEERAPQMVELLRSESAALAAEMPAGE